jgi:hypothetical protein
MWQHLHVVSDSGGLKAADSVDTLLGRRLSLFGSTKSKWIDANKILIVFPWEFSNECALALMAVKFFTRPDGIIIWI